MDGPREQAGPAVVLPEQVELRDGDDLLLRRHRADDLDGIHEQCQDPETVRFTTVPHPYSRQDAEDYLALVVREWEAGATASFAVEVDGRFAGTVDLRMREGAWTEVGFGLAPWARGRGVTTRALRLALNWGFRELGLVGARWTARVGNDGSRRVAERCGFTVEGTVRGLLVLRGQRLDGWIGSLMADDLKH